MSRGRRRPFIISEFSLIKMLQPLPFPDPKIFNPGYLGNASLNPMILMVALKSNADYYTYEKIVLNSS